MWNWRLQRKTADQQIQSDNVDVAINHTVQNVLTGRFIPGDRLKEAEISKATGLGLGYAREALQIMAGAKILSHQQNHGYRLLGMEEGQRTGCLDVLELSLSLALDLIAAGPQPQKFQAALHAFQHATAAPKDDVVDSLSRLFDLLDLLMAQSGNRYLPQVYLGARPVLLMSYLRQAVALKFKKAGPIAFHS
jgi:DNA-binding GntR family transcriptional regulator